MARTAATGEKGSDWRLVRTAANGGTAANGEWRVASSEWRMVGADPCVCHKAISHEGKRQRVAGGE
jgi:hypothetical protein